MELSCGAGKTAVFQELVGHVPEVVLLDSARLQEEDVRQKVQSMLEPVLGQNRVLARVTLDLDLNQVQIAEER